MFFQTTKKMTMRAPQPIPPSHENLLRTLSTSLHQLAQPLSIIQASLELALLKPTSAEQFKEVAEESLRQLGRTVDTLRFTSQLTRFYQPASDEAHVLLSHVLEDVITDLGRTLNTAQIQLCLVHSGREREIYFSPVRLRQLFFYILQAVQHLSQAGDIVQVEVQAHAGHVKLRIYHTPGRIAPPAQKTSAEDLTTRALALAEAIVTGAGFEFSVNTSPLLIVADFPVRRESQPHLVSKNKIEGTTTPRLAATTH
jgi:hypothetical protein